MELKRLFISDLPESATADDVRNRFKKYGIVEDVDIKERKELGSRNTSHYFAYVSLKVDNISLDQCLNDANTKTWHGEYVRITVARENFLDRLKREREESKSNGITYQPPPVPERPREIINRFNKNDEELKEPKRQFVKEEINNGSNFHNNLKKKRKFSEDDNKLEDDESPETVNKILKSDSKGFNFSANKSTQELFANNSQYQNGDAERGSFTFGFKANCANDFSQDKRNFEFESFSNKLTTDYSKDEEHYNEAEIQENFVETKQLLHRQKKWQQQFFFTYSDSRFEDGKQLLEKIGNIDKNRFLEDRKMMKYMVKIQKRSQLNYQNFLQQKSMDRMEKASKRIVS